MGYNQENFKRIRAEYETKALKAQEEADLRRAEVQQAIPGLLKLDEQLSKFGLRVMQAALEGGDTAGAIAALRDENQKILAERRMLLMANGYPADYCSPHYECEKCRDSGYVGIRMCECMRRRLVEAGMESSGLGKLMQKQSFENFSLDYYKDNAENYRRMKLQVQTLKNYAENFDLGKDHNPDSILILGGTGLGKTHISTSIAKVVIERGYDVYYTTAVGMISDFEYHRFGNGIAKGDADNIDRYLDSDLLILDDLGTEVVNQFTQSCLYHVINSRLNANKPTIVNSNLTPDDLRKVYFDRIFSRLMGEFKVMPFYGTDIRRQKVTGGR